MIRSSLTICLLRLFVVATVSVAVSAPAQNRLGFPTAHRLSSLSGNQLQTEAVQMEGLQLTPSGLQLTPGAINGQAQYRVRVAPNTQEIVPSWSARTPGDSGLRVQMNLPQAGGWFEAGSWGSGFPAPSARRLKWPDGSEYLASYALLESPVSEVGLLIELRRPSPDSPSPSLQLLTLSTSPPTEMKRPRLTNRTFGAVRNQPIEINIPFVPQAAVGRREWVERTCSPAVISMALQHKGISKSVLDLATRTYDPTADAFGVWNRAIMSAAEQGYTGYLTRFNRWSQVREALASGAIVGASIRMEPGEVQDPLNQFGRRMEGTRGHIILIRGILPDGRIITHDPASKDHGANLIWTPEDLGQAWFVKGGLAYILKP